MRIYIAGCITRNENYIQDFKRGEEIIRQAGYVPFNPTKPLGFEYKQYIDMGLNELMQCDAILLLNNWQQSKGACLEKHYAKTIGMKILKESDFN